MTKWGNEAMWKPKHGTVVVTKEQLASASPFLNCPIAQLPSCPISAQVSDVH
jgi:hypothetical protein